MNNPHTRQDEPELPGATPSDSGAVKGEPDAAELPRSDANFPIVGIGASAGGLEAFTELLSCLALDTGMGFVLVQHLDPVHESALTQLLSRVTALPVQVVTDHLRVQANHVYVIPPNTYLSIESGVLKLQLRDQSRMPRVRSTSSSSRWPPISTNVPLA